MATDDFFRARLDTVRVRTSLVSATGCNAAACPGAVGSDYVVRTVTGWVRR